MRVIGVICVLGFCVLVGRFTGLCWVPLMLLCFSYVDRESCNGPHCRWYLASG